MKMLLNRIPTHTLAIFSLGAVIFITLLSLFAIPSLQTQYSLKQFLPQDNALLNEDEKTRQAFQLPETQPFVITAQILESRDWFETSRIEDLSRLTDLLARLPGVKSTISLATVQGATNNENGLSVGPLLKSLPTEKWKSESLSNPLISPHFISKDGKTASIIINIQSLNNHDLKKLRHDLEVTSQTSIPFAKIKIGGTPAVQSDVGDLLQSELFNFVILGFVACFFVLALIFANWSPLVISFVAIICANIIVIAIMALAGFSFSILSSTIPILTTVDVVSLCIHTLLRYAEEKKASPFKSHKEIVLTTIRAILKPNFIASTTTMIGFLSLLTTDVPLIRDYGVTAAIAIIVGWAVTTALMLPLMLFLRGAEARDWAWRKARWGLHIFRRSGVWTALIVFICLGLALKGQSLSWSARLFDDLPTNHQVRLSTEIIDKELGGMIPVDIEIQGRPDAWNEPRLIEDLDKLLAEIRQSPGVGSAVGLPDLIAASNIDHSRLPASRSSTAEIYFLYSLSDYSPLKNFLNANSSSTRISVRTEDLPANKLHSLAENLRQKTEALFPDMSVKITGIGSTIHHLNNDLSHELIFGFWHSMFAIALVLTLVFKSIRWALVACIPNLVPPAALLGFLALSGTPIKPSVAIIFSIALGLAFNNTVYLLERLRALQKNSKSGTLDIEKMLWLEGNPCLISTLTLLAGFSVFMASYFAMNRIFGFYMLLSMLAGLVGDLILLPTMLKSCPWLLSPIKWKKEKTMATASALILIFGISIYSNPAHAQKSANTTSTRRPAQNVATSGYSVEQISKEISSRIGTNDEEFVAHMKIIEADKTVKDREMRIWRLSTDKKNHSLLVRMQKPTDLKGTSLLATIKNEKEDKWVYLPSNKQTRRLTGENTKGGILGSELSTEDFDFNRDQSVSTKIQKEVSVKGQKYLILESDVDKTSPNYSRILSYVSATEFLPVKVECFDKEGKLLKVITFSNYKEISDNKWRAQSIKIQNLQNKRGTDITLSQIKLNKNLKDSFFTPKSLEND